MRRLRPRIGIPGRVLIAVLLAISSAAVALGVSPGTAHAAAWGTMKNGYGLCLDDTGYSRTEGTQMQVWTCNGKATQNWHIYQQSNGILFMFQVQQSGMCLDEYQQTGPEVVQWPCNPNDPAQWWTGSENINGGYQFYGSGGTQDVMEASGAPGDLVTTVPTISGGNTYPWDSWGLPPAA
jgi:hypothetical protein